MNYDTLRRVDELINAYKSLKVLEETDESIVVSGEIDIHKKIEQFVLNKTYNITVIIPKSDNAIPYVIDSGKTIKTDYPHLNLDGRLCLATDIDIQFVLSRNQSLVNWMREFVEPYFVSYEYYERYGIFPLGDRQHGAKGIIESYMELFDVNEFQAKRIMLFLYREKYRGNKPCPCGSGVRMRKCHGNMLLKFYNNAVLLGQAKSDLETVAKEVIHNGHAR